MRLRGGRAAAAAAALALAASPALAGCGGVPALGPRLPPPEAAHFTGPAVGGVQAAVDLGGDDATARAVADALAREGAGASVAIAAILNDGSRHVRTPRFTAVDPAGEARELVPARAALEAAAGPGAAERAGLPPPRRTLRPDSAVTEYLVLRDLTPPEVAEVRMHLTRGREAVLRPAG